MINHIKYRIGKYITGRLTFKFSNFKPNSAGSYKMRNQITEYNINNLIPNLNNISNFFNDVPVILADNLEIDKNIEVKIKEKFIKSGSDKSTIHNYEKIYAYILNNVPENLNLLEIGMGTNNKNIISNMGVGGSPGASLRAFSSIFPNGKIYGADIDKEILFEEGNIKCYHLDQREYQNYLTLADKIRADRLDLIIDDGLHTQSSNLNSLMFALNYLSINGYLIIEDIPEYALETWKIISNLIDERYESQIIKTRHFYVFLLKKCK